MDPNQVPTTPQPPQEPIAPVVPQPQPVEQPQFSVPPVQPVEQPQFAAVPPVQPITPLVSATPFEVPSAAQPIAPVQQSVASSEIFGSSPQPVSSVVAAYPTKKLNKKLFIIIGAIVVGIGVLAAAAWLVIGYISANSLTLKEYSNDQYSLLVPDKYTQNVIGSDATFTEPNATPDTESKIEVTKVGSISTDRAAFLKAIDDKLTPDYIASSFSSTDKLTNVKIDKSTKGDTDYRIVTADVQKDGTTTGSLRFVYVFGATTAYAVVIGAHISDPALAANATKITDSFTIK